MSSIILSPKHGVNPSVSQCFYCGEDKNELILPGRMKNDQEAPRRAVWNMEPCDKCKGFMAAGIIMISVSESLTKDPKNPHRTGGWIVMKEEAVRRIFQGDLVEDICKRRVAFVPDEVWDVVGLPRGEAANVG